MAAEDSEAIEHKCHARTRGRRLLSKLMVGSRVRVWNSRTHKFNRTWKVLVARELGRSYILVDKNTKRVYIPTGDSYFR